MRELDQSSISRQFILFLLLGVNLTVFGQVGIRVPSPAAALDIRTLGNSAVTDAIKVVDSLGAELFIVNDAAMTGVGTHNPVSQLHVFENPGQGLIPSAPPTVVVEGDLPGILFNSALAGPTGYGRIEIEPNSGDLYAAWNDQNNFVFESRPIAGPPQQLAVVQGSNGWMGLGTPSPVQKLDVRGSAFVQNFIGVGLGKTVPAYPVDVAGTVNANSVRLTDGATAGYVLQSDASGFGMWVDPATLPSTDGDWIAGVNAQYNLNDSIGIGTGSPNSRLHVANGSVLFEGPGGSTPASGTGNRMMFIPGRGAIRAGGVNSYPFASLENDSEEVWNDSLIGNYSAAFGENTTASGDRSFASGLLSEALGANSIAMGSQSQAIGNSSVALGQGSLAQGAESVALGNGSALSDESFSFGRFCRTGGDGALALGELCRADGLNAVSVGYDASSNGDYARSFGYQTSASGNYSSAMGCYALTSADGAFTLGDQSTTTNLINSINNSFQSRFAGGYYLYSNSSASVGARLLPLSSSWSTISDSTKKENFIPVDGENILNKIADFDLSTWNYKGQDPKSHRHYGPMAQDFYAAFGQDDLGYIGNDTLIETADFLGLNFTAIQALEARTTELRAQNKALEEEVTALLELVDWLKQEVVSLRSEPASRKEDWDVETVMR